MAARQSLARSVACAALLVGLLPVYAAAEEQDPGPRFEHYRTRFPLVGAHQLVSCESCHRSGQFAGTPTRCFLCHDGGGLLAQTYKGIDHIRSTNECQDCHLMRAWVPSRVDHGNVRGSCGTCHNGVDAIGKHPGHIASTNDCEACHRTSTWLGAGIDHRGISSGCISCHNGTTARGKGPGHIQSPNDCELCHNTRNWDDATFDHSAVTGSCVSCHDGGVAEGKPDDHFMTSEDCIECHSTNRWEPATFAHTGPDYPGDHARRLDCEDCHPSNTSAVSYERPDLAPDCAGCHASDFKDDAHKKQDSPKILYTVVELRNCAGSCHIEKPRVGEHSVRSREW